MENSLLCILWIFVSILSLKYIFFLNILFLAPLGVPWDANAIRVSTIEE